MKHLVTLSRSSKIVDILSVLLIFLFVYTAVSKLADFGGFVAAMNNQPLPEWSKPLLISSLPYVEILVAVLLLIPKSRFIGFLSSLALMVAFTVYIVAGVSNLLAYVPCSCGGVIRTLTWKQHLVFNAFFLVAALYGVIACWPQRNNEETGYRYSSAV